MTWGSAVGSESSAATFLPQTFDTDPGLTFVIGELILTNQSVGDPGPDTFQFELTAAGLSRTFTMRQVSTANTADPLESADYITFLDDQFPNVSRDSFFALESSTARVQLLAAFTDAGIVTASAALAGLQNAALADLVLEFRGYGLVTGDGFVDGTPGFVEPVPETASILTVLAGLAMLMFRRLALTGQKD